MKQFGKLLFALAVFILSISMVAAQDGPLPNDPNVNPNANACLAGGSMEGKCGDSEYLWVGSWYKIRYDYGLISRDNFPDQYRWMLPDLREAAITRTTPRPVEVVTWPAAGCYYSSVYDLYIIWNGNQTQTPIDMTWDASNCGTPTTGVGGFLLVSTADAASADSFCAGNGYNYIDEVVSASTTGAWAIYRCQFP